MGLSVPMDEYCVAMTTCASDEDAQRLCTVLLEEQLAACVQVVEIHSHFVWKGGQQSKPEKLLLIKSRRALYSKIEAALQSAHPYETPEIICLPVIQGAAPYLSWINDVTMPNS
ncbi:MAG: divalent-cation tolerance protein CutA [Chloroflexota bacterium]|nr:divalent-cation tolerance protein CutA [Chloroflexota bacterium]